MAGTKKRKAAADTTAKTRTRGTPPALPAVVAPPAKRPRNEEAEVPSINEKEAKIMEANLKRTNELILSLWRKVARIEQTINNIDGTGVGGEDLQESVGLIDESVINITGMVEGIEAKLGAIEAIEGKVDSLAMKVNDLAKSVATAADDARQFTHLPRAILRRMSEMEDMLTNLVERAQAPPATTVTTYFR